MEINSDLQVLDTIKRYHLDANLPFQPGESLYVSSVGYLSLLPPAIVTGSNMIVAERHRDRHTDRQTDTHRCTDTDIHTHNTHKRQHIDTHTPRTRMQTNNSRTTTTHTHTYIHTI